MRLTMVCLALMAAAPALATALPPAATAAGPVDPTTLAAARLIAVKVWPAGSMTRMMDAMSGQFAASMSQSMLNLPLRDIVASSGMSAEDQKRIGPGTQRQVMAILDPDFQKRIDIMNSVMFPELGKAMSEIEPEMREALARAYAKRFSAAQLGEINGFFNTPTGAAYAAASLQIATDPDYLAGMQTVMPKIVKIMPAIMAKVKLQTDALPKPRTYKDLTPAERERIARLVGQSPAVPAKSSTP